MCMRGLVKQSTQVFAGLDNTLSHGQVVFRLCSTDTRFSDIARVSSSRATEGHKQFYPVRGCVTANN